MKNGKLKVIVMCGLPGSGKSRLAKQLDEKLQNPQGWGFSRKYESRCIDIDEYVIRHKKYGSSYDWGAPKNEDPLTYALRCAFEYRQDLKYLILDGLFTTQEQYKKIAEFVDVRSNTELEFHFFAEDRESCLWNDRGRENGRYGYSEEKSTCVTSIKNLPLEVPNLEELKKVVDIPVSLIMNKVERKSAFELWCHEVIDKVERSENGKLTSQSWSLGGTWGNCWDDYLHTEHGDPQPATFKELDNVMMAVCPNITFLQGRKIYSECVDTGEYGESDYYGGSTRHAYFECDLKKLYDLLLEWGYIQGDYV